MINNIEYREKYFLYIYLFNSKVIIGKIKKIVEVWKVLVLFCNWK